VPARWVVLAIARELADIEEEQVTYSA